MKTAVIYARVRTTAERQAREINNQLDLCRKFAKENGFTVEREYSDVETSGERSERTALAQMLADAGSTTWKTIITYGFDRISRNYKSIRKIYKQLKKHGKNIKFVSGFDEFNKDFILRG